MDEKRKGIAYQNKDVVSKIFAESLKEKAFDVYGLNLPKVVDVLPTNLPSIELNEMRIDNLFLLDDGSYAIIDYESSYSYLNKLKYLGYILRALRRLRQEGIDIRTVTIRMIVIYTADVERGKTNSALHVGALHLFTEEAFLTDIDGEREFIRLQNMIECGSPFNDEDMMTFIILPLTFRGRDLQKEYLNKVITLAKQIRQEEIQHYLLAGILSFSDKIIEDDVAEELRRKLNMTKVGKIIYDEMMEYGREVEIKTAEKVTKEVTKNVTETQTEKAIVGFIELCKKTGGSISDVVEYIVANYGFSEEEARKKVEMAW